MLRFCDIPAKGACCQNSMELATLSRQQLDKNTKESIAKLSSVLGTRAVKFNGKQFNWICFFREIPYYKKSMFSYKTL